MMPNDAISLANADVDLLRLPTEMLELIFENTQPNALLQLRQTCRALDTALLGRFIADYVRHVSCWVFDPARWLRLKKIMSSKRLSPWIQTVYLTADTNEERHNVGVGMTDEQRNVVKSARDRGIEGFQMLIFEVLSQLMTLSRGLQTPLVVDLDFTRGYSEPFELLQIHETILSAVAQSRGFKIQFLGLSPDSTAGLQDLSPSAQAGLLRATGSVQDLSYRVLGKEHDDYASTLRSRSGLADASRMIRSAHRLCRLSLDLSWTFVLADPPAFTASLLLANTFKHLQTLKLTDMFLTRRTLLTCLKRCAPTLKYLEINDVMVTSRDATWEAAFQFISTMPRLKELDIYNPCEWEKGGLVYHLEPDPSTFAFRCKLVKGDSSKGIRGLLEVGFFRRESMSHLG